MEEEWKPIPDSENQYFVSSFGRFKSLKNGKEHFLKPTLMKNGYYTIAIHLHGISNKRYAHRIVAEAFIPNPNNKPQVNHIDENKRNFSIENLEWVTPKENMNWASRTKRFMKNRASPIRSIDKQGNAVLYDGVNDAARKLGACHQNISSVLNGKAKSCKGLIFEKVIQEV